MPAAPPIAALRRASSPRPDRSFSSARRPARSDSRQPGSHLSFDFIFVFLALLTGLFPLYLKSATGFLFIALPALYLYFRPGGFVPVLKRTGLVLLLPAFALLSALWSDFPGETIYYALQFALTVLVALLIGNGTDEDKCLSGLFGMAAAHGLMNFAYGLSVGRIFAAEPLVGFAGSKNTTADMACLGFMVAAAYLGRGVSNRQGGRAIAASLVVLIQGSVIISAQSAGANAAIAGASGVMLILLVARRFPVQWRTGAMVVIVLVAVLALLTRSLWFDPLWDAYLALSGKSSDLTGRTWIWSRAETLIEQRPLLGRGFANFWREDDLDSKAIWDALYVGNHYGFNFHSSRYEILVYLGQVGLVLFTAVFCISLAALALRTAIEPKFMGIFFFSLIVYQALRFQFESLPLGLFSHSALMIYAALGYAWRPVDALSGGTIRRDRGRGLQGSRETSTIASGDLRHNSGSFG